MGKRDKRNLTKRGAVWYFEGIVGGRRVKRSLKTGKLEEALTRRGDVIREALAEHDQPPDPKPESRTFAEAAADALKAMDDWREARAEEAVAASTARDLHRSLRKDGAIVSHLGPLRLDAIDAATLRRWYEAAIVAKHLSAKTGDNALSAIERVFRHARNRGHLAATHRPVTEFSEQLRGERRTKRARAARDQRRRLAKHGVLTPEQVGQLVDAARVNGSEDYVVILLAVECGLRRGEISGLLWGDVHWGTGEEDATRAVEVRHSNSCGLGEDAPKSGRVRRPHLSRRLWCALRALYLARWEPSPEARVIKRHYSDLDYTALRRALKGAGLPSRTLQNLRATCSSLLKQWGVSPEYVRVAIGHENEAVAAAHYDQLDFTRYREPERLRSGETPMDLFARLCVVPERPKSHHESHPLAATARKAPKRQAAGWRPQRESNPLGLRAAS